MKKLIAAAMVGVFASSVVIAAADPVYKGNPKTNEVFQDNVSIGTASKSANGTLTVVDKQGNTVTLSPDGEGYYDVTVTGPDGQVKRVGNTGTGPAGRSLLTQGGPLIGALSMMAALAAAVVQATGNSDPVTTTT